MAYIEVPEQPATLSTELDVSTGHKEAKEGKGEVIRKKFPAELPKDLGSAIALFMQKERLNMTDASKRVHKLFINAYVVELQGEQRQKLQPQVEGKGRKKAPYLEELGL